VRAVVNLLMEKERLWIQQVEREENRLKKEVIRENISEVSENIAIIDSLLESIRKFREFPPENPAVFIRDLLSLTSTKQSILTQVSKVVSPPVEKKKI